MYGVAKLTLLDEYCMERRESLSKLHPIRLIFLTEKKKKKLASYHMHMVTGFECWRIIEGLFDLHYLDGAEYQICWNTIWC